jgi:hypothetical protein
MTSLLTTTTGTPHDALPPPYSPLLLPASLDRDSDAVSIISQAPSYTSHTTELPAYENIQPLGLPRVEYAPGFAPGNHGPFSAAAYTTSSSAELSHPARRQYENVVNRRAALRRALTNVDPNELVDGLLGVIDEGGASADTAHTNESEAVERQEEQAALANSLPRGAGSITAASNREMLLGYCPYIAPAPSFAARYPQPAFSQPATAPSMHRVLPANPHEDPELVGHAAAEQARSQRLYREGLLREMAAQNAQKQAEKAAALTGIVGPLSHLGQQRGLHGWRSGVMGSVERHIHFKRLQPGAMRPRMLLVRRIWS